MPAIATITPVPVAIELAISGEFGLPVDAWMSASASGSCADWPGSPRSFDGVIIEPMLTELRRGGLATASARQLSRVHRNRGIGDDLRDLLVGPQPRDLSGGERRGDRVDADELSDRDTAMRPDVDDQRGLVGMRRRQAPRPGCAG